MEEEVIEKPDVPDAAILRALENCYAIRATDLKFVPRGLDAYAWAYRATAGAQSYFVKVSKDTPVEAGAWLPLFLSQRDFREVIAPVPTQLDQLFGRAAELTLRVQPFVEGERAMDAGMTVELWARLGGFLQRLHAVDISGGLAGSIRRETFAARRLDWVQAMQQDIDRPPGRDDVTAEFLAFWREQRTTIAALIERMLNVRGAVADERWPMVLCHGDIHSGNLLLGHDGNMYVVDWDDAILAPKERDLMFVLAELPAAGKTEFFAAYGTEDINPRALAYYRHDWCIEDIGAFGQEVLDAEAGEATRANSLRWFKSLFEPGGSVSIAMAETTMGLRT